MRAVLATLLVLSAVSAFSGAAFAEGRTSAQPVAAESGRWCSISSTLIGSGIVQAALREAANSTIGWIMSVS